MGIPDLTLKLTKPQKEKLLELGFKGHEIGDILFQTIFVTIGSSRTIFAAITSVEHETDGQQRASLNLGVHIPKASENIVYSIPNGSYQKVEIDIRGKLYLCHPHGKRDEGFCIGVFEPPVTKV